MNFTGKKSILILAGSIVVFALSSAIAVALKQDIYGGLKVSLLTVSFLIPIATVMVLIIRKQFEKWQLEVTSGGISKIISPPHYRLGRLTCLALSYIFLIGGPFILTFFPDVLGFMDLFYKVIHFESFFFSGFLILYLASLRAEFSPNFRSRLSHGPPFSVGASLLMALIVLALHLLLSAIQQELAWIGTTLFIVCWLFYMFLLRDTGFGMGSGNDSGQVPK